VSTPRTHLPRANELARSPFIDSAAGLLGTCGTRYRYYTRAVCVRVLQCDTERSGFQRDRDTRRRPVPIVLVVVVRETNETRKRASVCRRSTTWHRIEISNAVSAEWVAELAAGRKGASLVRTCATAPVRCPKSARCVGVRTGCLKRSKVCVGATHSAGRGA